MLFDLWHSGHTEVERIGADYLFTRLAQTIAWCCDHVRYDDPVTSLRTEELRPKLLVANRDESVCDVGSARGWRVRSEVPDTVRTFPDLRGGRLLVYFPDADLFDGVAEVHSNGFFDVHNTPGWDTWVSYFEDSHDRGDYSRYLLSYVPKQLVDLAQVGIDVNPEQCIRWLPECDVRVRTYLTPYLAHLPWWNTL